MPSLAVSKHKKDYLEQADRFDKVCNRGHPLALYHANPLQQKLHSAVELIRVGLKRWVFAIWGQRGGKSVAGLMEDFKWAIDHPGSYLWVVSPSYGLSEILWDEIGKWVDMDIIWSKTIRHPRKIKLIEPWKSVLEFKSADDPDSLVARGIDAFHGDELGMLLPSNGYRAWLNMIGRAKAGSKVVGWITTTPYDGGGWLNMVLDKSCSWFPDLEVFSGSTFESGLVTEEEIDYWKKNMDPKYFDERVMGELGVKWGGLIYPDFSWEAVKCQAFKIDTQWPIYVGIDLGFPGYTAITIHTRNFETGIYYQLAEHLQTQMTGTEIARKIYDLLKNLPREGPLKITRIFFDPTGSQKDFRHRINMYDVIKPLQAMNPKILNDNGKPMIEIGGVISAKPQGIEVCRMLLREERDRIFEGCIQTAQALMRYATVGGTLLEGNADKIQKDHAHLPDARRYVLASVETLMPHKKSMKEEHKEKPLNELQMLKKLYGEGPRTIRSPVMI